MYCIQGLGLGANAMYVLTPHLNTFLTVQLAWGFSVALANFTCFGVTGQSHYTPVYACYSE